MGKRILSALMTVALCLSLLPTTVFAATPTVSILGTTLTTGKSYTISGTTITEEVSTPAEPYLSYNADGTLTVHGAIDLSDSNLTNPAIEFSGGDLTIEGDRGNLTLNNVNGNGGTLNLVGGFAFGITDGSSLPSIHTYMQYNSEGNPSYDGTITIKGAESASNPLISGSLDIQSAYSVTITAANGAICAKDNPMTIKTQLDGSNITLSSNSADIPTVTAGSVIEAGGSSGTTITITNKGGPTSASDATLSASGSIKENNTELEEWLVTSEEASGQIFEVSQDIKISQINIGKTNSGHPIHPKKVTIKNPSEEYKTLTVTGDIHLSGDDSVPLFLEGKLKVVVNGRIDIGASAGANGIVNIGEGVDLTTKCSGESQSFETLKIGAGAKFTTGTADKNSYLSVKNLEMGEDAVLNLSGSPVAIAAFEDNNTFEASVTPFLPAGCHVGAWESYYTILDEKDQPVTSLQFVSKSKYTIDVSADPEGAGTVSGSGEYNRTYESGKITITQPTEEGGSTTVDFTHGTNTNESATVTAEENPGYKFTGWTDNLWRDQTKVFSTDKTYTFPVTSNRELVAHFVEKEPLNFTLEASKTSLTGGGEITLTIKDLPEGFPTDKTMTLTCNNNSIEIDPATGRSWTVELPDATETYTFTATYNEDDTDENYRKSTAECTVSVTAKTATNLTLTANKPTLLGGGDVTLTLTGLPSGGTATLSCNPTIDIQNPEGTASAEGTISWTVTLNEAKPYTFTASYDGDATHKAASATCTVSVTATYNVKVSAGAGGTVSNHSGTYADGAKVTVTATPNPGYYFVNWTENNQAINGAGASYTFTVNGNRNLVANFQAKTTPTLTLTANPADPLLGGNAVTLTLTGLPSGGTATLSCPGLTIENPQGTTWTVNLPNATQTYIFKASYAGDATHNAATSNECTVSVDQKYAVTGAVNPSDGGTVTGGGDFKAGDSVTVTAIPKDGYVFVNWTDEQGNEVSKNNPYEFEVEKDCTLTANFAKLYTINVSAEEGGSATGGGTFEEGTSITVTATANEDYTFVNWTENDVEVSKDADYTFPIDGDRDLVAHFVEKPKTTYNITVNADPEDGGTVDGGGIFEEGTSITVTATANEGYTFTGWTEDGVNVDNAGATYKFTVTGSRTLTANFQKDEPEPTMYTISVSAGEGGSVTGGGTFEEGTSITVTATANEGYTFTGWTEDGVNVDNAGATYKFTVTGSRTLTANFQKDEPEPTMYTISVSAGEGGNATGGGTFEEGTSITVTAMANEGYTFVNWTENDAEVSKDANYTFPVNGNHNLVANFEKNNEPDPPEPTYYTVTVKANPPEGGTVTISPASNDGRYEENTSVTVTATANEGYKFENWTKDGVKVDDVQAEYTFHVNSDRTLTANFTKNDEPNPPEPPGPIEYTTPNGYTIRVFAEPPEAGMVWVDDTHYASMSYLAAKAKANANYAFIQWTESGKVISTSPCHTFSANTNHEFVAHFIERESGTPIGEIPDLMLIADHFSLTGGGPVTLTLTGLPEGGSATLICSSDNSIEIPEAIISKENEIQWTVQLPNRTGEYTFVANYAGDGTTYGATSASCTVSVTGTSQKPENPDPPVPTPPVETDTGSHGNSGTSSDALLPIIVEETVNGNVSSNHDRASSGSLITLTVNPDSGYELSRLTILDSQKNQVKSTAQSENQYTFVMPVRAVTVTAVFAQPQDSADESCDGGTDCPSRAFSDLGGVGTWYHEAVDTVLKNQWMSGYNRSTFGPDRPLSRAQFAQILYNKEGKPEVSGGSIFTDVADNAWCAAAIQWAVERGIINGYGNGFFGPNDSITREQLAVMLWRYAGSPAATNQNLSFSDTDKIGSYAVNALCWAVEKGVMNGKSSEILDPKGLATRAQTAQMLINFMKIS